VSVKPSAAAAAPTGNAEAAGGRPAPDRYLVVGNPIGHSRSPQIHARFASQTGQAISYESLLVPVEPADAFARAVAAFIAAGGRGLNVTLPFKERAFALATRHTPRALLAGAVNTLSAGVDGLHGDNTDGAGLVTDLQQRLGVDLAGKTVLLLGAGGAARGVVMSLLQAGIAELIVANRTPARALALAAHFNGAAAVREAGLPPVRGLAQAAARPADVIVNATSSGTLGADLVLPAGLFAGCSLAYDCAYGAYQTPFMMQAERGGAARVADGLGMLVEQAAESFFVWRGVRPQTAEVYRMLRDSVSRQAVGAADDS
jgi:shikimate dehydrogenase